MTAKIYFADAHSHSNPINGLGSEQISKKFKESGGWFVAFVMLPSWDYVRRLPSSLEDYEKILDLFIKDCKKAKGTGIKVNCFAGLHPAEIDKLIESGMEAARVERLALSIVEHLGKLCSNNIIDGIGEVGRPHYKVKVETAIVSEAVLERALEISKDLGCKVQLHLENMKGFTALNIKKLIGRIGVNEEKVLIHHTTLNVLIEAQELGIWSTYPGIKEGLEAMFKSLKKFDKILIESDFIDDPKRPGRVLYPWDLPINEMSLLEKGLINEEALQKINVENTEKFFEVVF